jgi:FkbM family methyltransferase
VQRKIYTNKKVGKDYCLDVIENKKAYTIKLRDNTSDFFIFSQIFIRKDYKLFFDEVIKEIDLERQVNIIDAGANIGLATLYFYAYIPNSIIIMLEPEKNNFEILEYNIKQNIPDNQNIIPLKAALWYEDTQLEIGNEFRDKSHCAFTVSTVTGLTNNELLTNAYSLSSIMKKYQLEGIDILKMDIEGAEKDIFKYKDEIDYFLPKCKFVAIEVHEEFIKEKEILDILESHNFSVQPHSGEYMIAKNTGLLTKNNISRVEKN